MQKRTIEVTVFDVGDIVKIDIINQPINHVAKDIIGNARKLIVLRRKDLKSGEISYSCMTDTKKFVTLHQPQIQELECIGSIPEIAKFFDNDAEVEDET